MRRSSRTRRPRRFRLQIPRQERSIDNGSRRNECYPIGPCALNSGIKSVRKLNYVFVRKDVFRLRPNLLFALTLFEDGRVPDQYLIPASRWAAPDALFVDRDYEGKTSKPEYGLNLSRTRLSQLEPFRFEKAAADIFGQSVLT